ncbi:type II toxin-antitoxin system RelB/ParD family antitoxin [Streptococcus lutetiensis]|uniref:type II toxin-antitoxin system RelB/ParD family antitoxin n=1 Tax=Streptococcus lutetiensis TaxID=150055 RepID=UPI00356438A4
MMVAIIERNRDFKFLTNKELLEQAKINLKKQGTTLSKALDLFVKQVAITGEINLMSEEELEKERLFRQLQTEVNESIAEYKTGKYYTEEDLNERYGL